MASSADEIRKLDSSVIQTIPVGRFQNEGDALSRAPVQCLKWLIRRWNRLKPHIVEIMKLRWLQDARFRERGAEEPAVLCPHQSVAVNFSPLPIGKSDDLLRKDVVQFMLIKVTTPSLS